MNDTLERQILNRNACLAVVGLGYVGLPLAMAFARTGFKVLGIDVDSPKIETLRTGQTYLKDVAASDVAGALAAGRFQVSTSYAPLTEAGAIFICVPTPFDAMKAPDLSLVEDASHQLAKVLRPGQIVILVSTTYPGTTEEIVLPILNTSNLQVGEDFFLAFSPERIDPGHTSSSGWTVENTPKVVGGVTSRCSQLAALVLSQLTPSVHVVSTPRTAEMTKLLENTFRSVNIALVNELTLLSERMDIDIWEVIEAATTKPFGFMPFYPGPGVGGHCIPVDPYYLSWRAREFDFYTKFIELAAEVNSEMPYHAVETIGRALNRAGLPFRGSKILILGVAFKRDVDDARNSPAQRLIELLLNAGGKISYHDPHVPIFEAGGNVFLKERNTFRSIDLTQDSLQTADCVVIVTGHSTVDYDVVLNDSRIVVDLVNATSRATAQTDKVIRLGVPPK